MDAEPERAVAVLLTIDDELGRPIELGWIAIRRRERKQNPVVGLHRTAVEVVVVLHEPSHGDRRVGAEELLESEQHHIWFLDQTSQIVRMGAEVPDR